MFCFCFAAYFDESMNGRREEYTWECEGNVAILSIASCAVEWNGLDCVSDQIALVVRLAFRLDFKSIG
jgi:hypothetical protein